MDVYVLWAIELRRIDTGRFTRDVFKPIVSCPSRLLRRLCVCVCVDALSHMPQCETETVCWVGYAHMIRF